jgi:hypothetical protein
MPTDLRSAPQPKLLLGLPLAALAVMVGGLLALSVVFSVASPPSCGEEVGALNGKVPKRLIPIYQQASAKFRLGERGPSILAGINWVETGFGTNLGVSSAAAEGWMQFLPESWATFGVDGNGDGVKDPYNPWDAIFAAAHLLRYLGAPGNWHDAIYGYNHAEWYVEKVERAADDYSADVSSALASSTCSASPRGKIVGKAIRLFFPARIQTTPRCPVGRGRIPRASRRPHLAGRRLAPRELRPARHRRPGVGASDPRRRNGDGHGSRRRPGLGRDRATRCP